MICFSFAATVDDLIPNFVFLCALIVEKIVSEICFAIPYRTFLVTLSVRHRLMAKK